MATRPDSTTTPTPRATPASWYELGREHRRRHVDLALAIADQLRGLGITHPDAHLAIAAFSRGWLSADTVAALDLDAFRITGSLAAFANQEVSTCSR